MHNYHLRPRSGLRGEPRLAAALPRPRIAAGERREPIEKRRRPERPADRLGGAQRRDEGRVRLLGDQVGEAPAAARKQRRDLDEPVVAAGITRDYGDTCIFSIFLRRPTRSRVPRRAVSGQHLIRPRRLEST